MTMVAIGGIVLLLILGAWLLMRSGPSGWGSNTPPEQLQRRGQGLSSFLLPDGRQSGTVEAGIVDGSNEAQASKFDKMLEDLSVNAPGAIVPWRHSEDRNNVNVRFRIGREATTEEEKDWPMIPGIKETATGMTFVPIEYTRPFNFITYDRDKYLILISGTEDVTGTRAQQLLVVWDRKNKRQLRKLDRRILSYQGRDPSETGPVDAVRNWDGNLLEVMKRTLPGREFDAMPRGGHGTTLWLTKSWGSHTKESARRLAAVSYYRTIGHLETIPIMTEAA